jgi:hypothetical protein
MPHGYTPQQVYWSLEHNLLEPSGRVADGWFEHEDKAYITKKFEEKAVLPALIRIPKFMAVERPRNISFANYGETTPNGLHVKSPVDIFIAYQSLAVEELLSYERGNLDKKLETELRREIGNVNSQLEKIQAELRQSEESVYKMRSQLESVQAERRQSEETVYNMRSQLHKTQAEVERSETTRKELHSQLEEMQFKFQQSMELSNNLRLVLAGNYTEPSSELFRRFLRKFFGRGANLSRPYLHAGGNCWVANLEKLSALSDDVDWQGSPVVLYENRVKLGTPHAVHQDIRDIGNGKYSCWNGVLYFSTSDNSDPNTNGRTYTLEIELTSTESN